MNKVETILSNLTDLAKSSLPMLDCVSFGLWHRSFLRVGIL
jgi:hypothetical protein